MLKLMMTLVIWLLSMHLMVMHHHHHVVYEAFQQLTPNVIEQTIRIGFVNHMLKVGFDYETAIVFIPSYFIKNIQKQSLSYDLAIHMFDDGNACFMYCSEIRLTVSYNVFDYPSTLTRRYILDGG